MNTGAKTQDAFIQANLTTAEQDASHSALLYLLQEVSRLASPVHNSCLDPKSPSTGRSGTTRQDDCIVQTKEEDGHLFHTLNSSCQNSMSGALPCNGVNKVEESHSSMLTALIEPNGQVNSPWKVLSLINLQCERLQHQRDAEEPSFIISGRQAPVTHEEDVMMREEGSGGLRIYETQCCVKDSMMGCTVSPQPAEKTDSVIPEPVKKTATAALSQAHMPSTPCNPQMCYNPNENTSVALPKSALTLDCNANIVLTTELPCDAQLSSQSTAQTSSQALPCTAERCHSRPQKHNELTGSDPESIPVLIEETLTPVEQLKSSSYNVPPAKLQAELRPLQKEEVAPLTSLQWRIKTPRKQPHPSRSVDIQDPDIQGVTFRMGTELDDNREQCRLLITSKYSKEIFKSVRKPRLKTRISQKSLKTSSSDEESDTTTTFSKGKVCASCCTRKTPMWRDAEDGTPLCNACGIRYKKYRVRCVNCWHIPRKEGNSSSCCLKCGNSVRLTSAQRKHTA